MILVAVVLPSLSSVDAFDLGSTSFWEDIVRLLLQGGLKVIGANLLKDFGGTVGGDDESAVTRGNLGLVWAPNISSPR